MPKSPAKRGFFYLFLVSLCLWSCVYSSLALAVSRPYWDRLLHIDRGRSLVESSEFFITSNGKINASAEQEKFIELLKSTDGFSLACQFPARYKWLRSQAKDVPQFDIKQCNELQDFVKNFQKKDFYIAYVSEFLDAPASAFGHLMLVFSDGSTPLDLADTIHFAASTNREGFAQYVAKGLTGKFEGYYLREPFFLKKKDYLLFEQRAIHLYKIPFTEDQIENMVLHLYELRKAKFKYYFVDANCAYQLAELMNVADPTQDFSLQLNQAVLPIDVVRLHSGHISSHQALAPTVIRQKALTKKLSPSEMNHVRAVLDQEERIQSDDSDTVKEILYLNYQYAFRRRRSAYADHAEIELLNFKESTQSIHIPDPAIKEKTTNWSVGVSSTKNGTTYGRVHFAPLGQQSLQEQVKSESRLSLLETTVDIANDSARLKKLKVLSMTSSPNSLELHHPWSWGTEIGFNRENKSHNLAGEAEVRAGKTWLTGDLRIEGWMSVGVDHTTHTNGYLKPQVGAAYLLTPDIAIGASSYNKQYAQGSFHMTQLNFQYKGIQLQHSPSGHKETTLMVNIPF